MKAIILYFQFFTAIPIPIPIGDVEETFREGVYFFPIFAFIYGGIHALLFYLLSLCFPISIVWVLMLAFDVVITRGFHYDALSDMVDGMFSSRKKEQILEIMKDSNIGAMGVLGLILYFLGMVQFGNCNLERQSILWEQVKYIWVMKTLSRGGLCFLLMNYTYSGASQGLGTMLIGIKTWKVLLAQAMFGGVAVLLGGWPYLGVYLIVLILLLIYRAWILRSLDGLNGDTIGASTLLGEWCLHLLFTAL